MKEFHDMEAIEGKEIVNAKNKIFQIAMKQRLWKICMQLQLQVILAAIYHL